MVEKTIIKVVGWTLVGAVVTTSLALTQKAINLGVDKLESALKKPNFDITTDTTN